VLATDDPKQQKQLGRKIKGFDEVAWQEESQQLMVRVLLGKFSQNLEWRSLLLATKDKQLVEVNPHDRQWTAGMTEDQVLASGAEPIQIQERQQARQGTRKRPRHLACRKEMIGQ